MAVDVPIPRRGIPIRERMAFYTAPPDERGCRLWLGKPNKSGYGQVGNGSGGAKMAHRVAYELAGNVLDHRPIHHKCGQKLCVEPTHLQPVEPHENVAEMFERSSYKARIAALESALAGMDPNHELLNF